MGTLLFDYVATGTEGRPAQYFARPIQQWTGSFTVTVTCSPPAAGTYNLLWILRRTSDNFACASFGASLLDGQTASVGNYTVGNPPFSWHALDWDQVEFGIDTASSNPPAGMDFQLSFAGAGITPTVGICEYGSGKKNASLQVVDTIPAAVGIILRNPLSLWSYPLAIGVLASPLVLDTFCAQPPPADVDLAPGDFIGVLPPFRYTEAHRKIGVKIHRLLWDEYCKCNDPPPGRPPPVGPGVTNINQPTWYVTNVTNNISNTDIANTFNFILNYVAGSTAIQNQQTAALAYPTRCPPESWEEGTVHSSLIGEGRFAVSNVVGFKIEVTDRNLSEPVLAGQPMYLWNMGWISILAGELLLEEKRVTREGYLWFPCGIASATEFTFTLKDFTELKVTELVKPAEIELMG